MSASATGMRVCILSLSMVFVANIDVWIVRDDVNVIACGRVSCMFLQRRPGSYSLRSSRRSFIYRGLAHREERRRECSIRECSRGVSAVDDDDACAS
jgi:hypothetical protein